MKIRRIDIILLISCVIVFGGFTLFTRFSGDKGNKISVFVDGECIGKYSLNENGCYNIQGYDGGYNTLLIENGTAKIIDADCPDKLCATQKAISLSKETICCLPHRVIIEVISDNGAMSDSSNEVDAIAR